MQINMKNWLIWIILGLFIIGGLLQGNLFGIHNPVVAIVGKKKIRASDVRRYMSLIRIPEGVEDSTYVQNYIFMNAMELVIQRTILTQECERLGFVVSDEKIAEFIRKQPQFCINGKFSRELFLAELAKLKLTEMDYKEIVKENLLHKQLFFMWSSTFIIPKKILRAIACARTQKRNARFSKVYHNSIIVPKLSDAQLKAYFNKNKEKFKEKENKIFKIIKITDEKLVQKVNFSLYRQKFDQVATDSKLNVEVYNSTNLSNLPAGVVKQINEISENIKLGIGENSSLYMIGNEYYAFKLIKSEPGFIPPFESIKSKVREVYREEYIKNHIAPRGWTQITDLKIGSNVDGIPSCVLEAIFFNPIGQTVKIHQSDCTYIVIVDSIKNEEPTKEDLETAEAIAKSSMLDTMIPAAIATLHIKYRMTVCI